MREKGCFDDWLDSGRRTTRPRETSADDGKRGRIVAFGKRNLLVTATIDFWHPTGQAYRRASHKTRRLFNAAVFDRLEVRDRKLAGVAYQPPFDLLFSRNGLEYDTLVAPTGFEPALPP